MLGLSLSEFLRLIAPLIVVQIILDVIALVSLVKSEKPRFLPKWAWAVIIIFVSTFGAIGYLIFGRERDE